MYDIYTIFIKTYNNFKQSVISRFAGDIATKA